MLVDVVCTEMKVGLSGEVEVSEVSVSMFCHHSWWRRGEKGITEGGKKK